MQYFQIVIGQIGTFIIYAAIGVIAVKAKVFDKQGLDILARLITKICLPLLIFTNTINGVTRQAFLSSLHVLAVAAAMYACLGAVCTGLAALFRLQGNERNVYRASSMFGNVGFMGIPVICALFPDEGPLYIALITVIDQLALWTVGVDLTAPVEQISRLSVRERVHKMINPATVGLALAVCGVLLGVALPETLNTALVKTGSAATPLAMIYLGGMFCCIDLKKYLFKKEFYAAVLIKMCACPLLICAVLRSIPGVATALAVTMGVIAAMPGMSSVAMLAQNQKSAGDYSAGMIFFTTLCSIVTLPLVCLALGQ